MCVKSDVNEDDRRVVVRRQWNGYMEATYRFDQLEDPHWSSFSGGVNAPTPRPYIHAYVMCDGMLDGELAHSGVHGPCPHRIKVCVVQKINTKDVIADLKKIADSKPTR